MRGSFIPSIYNIFRENCNGINNLKTSIDNETDETNCEEWSTKICDNHWDYRNGIDELNCPYSVPYYLKETIFKCQKNEHYCANQNGTMSCLSIERVGDGFIDCLGATDEREIIAREKPYSFSFELFKCRSKGSINPLLLCDKYRDCPQNDDEIICPWLSNSACLWNEFACKNGTLRKIRKTM